MKNFLEKSTLILVLMLVGLIDIKAQGQTSSYTYACSVDYNVNRNGQSGLLAHINAKVVGRKGHRIQVGMMFATFDQNGENIQAVGGRQETVSVTSNDQTFRDVQVFIPYEDYLFNSIGQYCIIDLDLGEVVYMDFNDMFTLDETKVHVQQNSQNNNDVSIMRAEGVAVTDDKGNWGDWKSSNTVIVNDIKNSKFVIQLENPETLHLTRTDKGTTDNKGTQHMVAYAVNQAGTNVKIQLDVYTDKRMFITLTYPTFSVMYKIKNN